MTYDNSPGSPDGPPKVPLASRLGFAAGILITGVALTFALVGMVWAIAWMITNFPGA